MAESIYRKASLSMIPYGAKEDVLPSIKPTDGSGDFTFSRDADIEATRVNSSGLIEKAKVNLLTYSNDFSNVAWSSVSTTETSGQTGYDGSSDAWLLAKFGSSARVQQSVVYSGVNTWSVYAKAGSLNWVMLNNGSNSAWFDLQNGVVGTLSGGIGSSIESIGSGWYRCSVTDNLSSGTVVRIYPSQADNDISGTSGNIYIQDAQLNHGLVAQDYVETTTTAVVEGLTADLPRLDYSGGASCPSLLLEPSRTNILPYSEYFGNSNYLKDGVTATANDAISPEGVQNAYSVVESAISEDHRILWNNGFSATGNTNYSFSVYVKKISGQPTRHIYWMCQEGGNAIYAHFDMDDFSVNEQNDNGTGSIVDADIVPVGNDWYRLTLSGIVSSSTGTYYNQLYFETTPRTGFSAEIYTGNGTSGFELYGWQIEAGSYATSYIPTYSEAANRGDEECEKTGISSLIGQTEGTMFIDFVWDGVSDVVADNVIMSLDPQYYGTSTITISNYNGALYARVTSGLTIIQNLNASILLTSGTRYKIGFAYANNDFSFYVNGNLVNSASSGTPPATSSVYLNNNHPNAKNVNQALLFKTRLTNAELASLTTI